MNGGVEVLTSNEVGFVLCSSASTCRKEQHDRGFAKGKDLKETKAALGEDN